jgi:hypothetical protein
MNKMQSGVKRTRDDLDDDDDLLAAGRRFTSAVTIQAKKVKRSFALGNTNGASKTVETKSQSYIPPHKRTNATKGTSTSTPSFKSLFHRMKSVSPKKQSNPFIHTTILMERLGKTEAESLKIACTTTNSLFRERLQDMGVVSDFDILVATSYAAKDGDMMHNLTISTREQFTVTQSTQLRSIFSSFGKIGFMEWLAGAKGWRFENVDRSPDGLKWKQSVLIKLNCLQDVFKNFAPDQQKYVFVGSKRYTWRKASELQLAVSDIRMWLETLDQTPLVKKLLCNSFKGPDSCVHWAHHHPLNQYPLTVVTKASMLELVNGIIRIFMDQFIDITGVPLGTRWQRLPASDKRQTDWESAKSIDPDWTKERFVKLLNGTEKL